MRRIVIVVFAFGSCGFLGCVGMRVEPVEETQYSGYQPIDPIPAQTVQLFDPGMKQEQTYYWASLPDAISKTSLLPLQTAQVSVAKTDASGEISYLASAVSAESGSYEVVMDFMKYRVEDVYDAAGDYQGSGRVGVGLRMRARVVTNKANLNLGGIGAIGAEASIGHLSGSISVDIIGIDSKDVTNLIPLTSKIDETSIQSALEALASIKSKLWETGTELTPHLVAMLQARPGAGTEIRAQVSRFLKSQAGDCLRVYWKPDGTNIDAEHEANLTAWMKQHQLDADPGALTMFLRAADFETLRVKAISDLKIECK